MIRSCLTIIMLLFLGAKNAYAEESSNKLVSDLENKVIDITSNFDGSELFIFGASRNPVNQVSDTKRGIIIEVIGTTKSRIVRKKEKKFGIWVNGTKEVLAGVPDFYHITSTREINELLTASNQQNNAIGIINHLQKENSHVNHDILNALIKIKEQKNLYQFNEGTLELKENMLFSTKVSLPNNIAEGFYIIKTHLTARNKVIDVTKQLLVVKKVGIGNFLFNMAHNSPFTYGIFSILVALISGWAASEVFRRLRG